MVYINLIAIVSIAVFYLVYRNVVEKGYIGDYGTNQLLDNKIKIRVVILCAFLLKLLTSAIYYGFSTDMSCFYAWSSHVAQNGISSFYDQSFADYPPGYVYIMYILGLFINIFNFSSGSPLTAMLLKAPSILCDVAAGYLIYKIARTRFKESTAMICFFLYVFNPAIYINSSVWGQVDSVLTFFVLYMLYYLTKEKYSYAIMAFALGALIKPQMAFFFPILLFACFRGAFLTRIDNRYKFEFNSSRFFTILLWAFLGIGSILLLMCPLGFSKVINQYLNTVGSYNYASVNAYNLWEFLGQNWKEQTNTFLGLPFYIYGYGAIVVAVILSGLIFFMGKLKEDTKLYLSAAFLLITIFMFSVRMHERYMYPALALLFIVYLTKPDINMYIMYAMFSVAHFYNVSHVLFFFDAENFDWEAAVPKTIAFFTLIVYGLFVYITVLYVKNANQESTEPLPQIKDGKGKIQKSQGKGQTEPMPMKKKQYNQNKMMFRSSGKVKFTKWDWLIMLGITVVYALVAFHNLGYNYAPETEYKVETVDTTLTFHFPEGTQISKVSVYNSYHENRQFLIESLDTDTNTWVRIVGNNKEFKYPVFASVFKWNSIELTKICDAATQDDYVYKEDEPNDITSTNIHGNTTCIKMTTKSTEDTTNLLEMVFLDKDGNIVTPTNTSDYPELFDEQDLYDPTESYRSGTYFDEVYHARTAYEFLHGLPTYEWTHPPLGKILIAVGVSIFGMNPFGWRFMGTLFGVLMLPFIFLFARRIFKKTWIAGVTCLFFAVDFMHFAQTRIATIDVYITFFILIMYYFMYQYTTESYYDKKLYKTLLPLGLSGVTMGLGIASKVTGAYAAVGLAVIFFANLYNRYKEYRYACNDPEGTTNGMEHSYVISKFKKNTIITLLFCVLVFLVIPFIIYTLSYIPFINKYRFEDLGLLERMWINQGDMFHYHAYLKATHPFSSTWFEWPIMARPIYYFARDISSTMAEGISSFGNPLIWWGGIVAFIGTIYYTIRDKDRAGAFLLVSYLAQYLPWVLVSRCTFIYHYFPSVPFVILMLAYCIYHLMTERPKLKTAIIIFIALTVILFVMFYPVLSGMPVSKVYVNYFIRWFESWVLLYR